MRNKKSANARFLADDYQRNVDLTIQWNRWLMKPIGTWPYSRIDSRIGKFLSRVTNTVCYGLIMFLFVPCLLFLILDVESFSGKIRLVGPLSFFVMTFLKYYLLMFHEDDIRECVEHIKWDWRNIGHGEDKNVMTVYANYGRKLMAMCTFFVYGSFVFYYFITPISVGKARDGNLTFIPMAFPFATIIADVRVSPTNEILYSVQVLAGVLIHSITSAACTLAAAFAVHACGQMEILMIWLEHLIDGRSDMNKSVDSRIANIVDQHVRVLRFLALTEKSLQQISFVEFLGCTMNLCLLGFYIIQEWNQSKMSQIITYATLLSSFTFNIFIFCYIGELVAEQCQKVGEMTYMIEWYRLARKKKLCCILIIAMSNSSIKFTAGNMVELSISTFSDVVKTSVAFLNMLRAIT